MPRRTGTAPHEIARRLELQQQDMTRRGHSEQLELIPTDYQHVRPRYEMVRLVEIHFRGMPPEDGLIESIRRAGIREPPAVRDTGFTDAEHYRYEAITGSRRLEAARQLQMDMVPVAIYPVNTPAHVVYALSLTDNLQRHANPLGDVEDIENLQAMGWSLEQMATQLGIPLRTLRSRAALTNLAPILRVAVTDGFLPLSLTMRVARLRQEQQLMLQALITDRIERGEDPRITSGDVRAIVEMSGYAGARLVDLDDVVQSEQADAFPETIAAAPSGLPQELMAVTRIDADHVSINGVIYSRGPWSLWTDNTGSIVYPNPPDMLGIDFVENVAQPRSNSSDETARLHPSVRDVLGPLPSNVEDEDQERTRVLELLAGSETWPSTILLLEAVARALPVEPNNDSDSFHISIEYLLVLARRRASART